MNKKPVVYLLPLVIIFVVVAAISFFFSPWAPLVLLAALAVWVPIFWFILRHTQNTSYRDRSWARLKAFEKDGDARTFLRQEEQEAAALGAKSWSRDTRQLNRVYRARALAALGKNEEAAALLAGLEGTRFSSYTATQYRAAADALKAEAPKAGTPGDE